MAGEWGELVAEIERIANFALRIQIDVMDGHLVPSISFPYNKTILSEQEFPYKGRIDFDIHLMVQNPQEVGNRFIKAGATTIIAQIEGFRESTADSVFREWKENGAVTGVSLLLDTPIEEIVPLIESNVVSIVQVMSIARIGYQGEKFDERAITRIKELREMYPEITIAVDGGVKIENVKRIVATGVHIIGVGSAIMKEEDPVGALYMFEESVRS